MLKVNERRTAIPARGSGVQRSACSCCAAADRFGAPGFVNESVARQLQVVPVELDGARVGRPRLQPQDELMATQSSDTPFRIQVTCDGVPANAAARDTIQAIALREIGRYKEQLRLATVKVAARKHDVVECDVQLFGQGLDHAGGRSDRGSLEHAVSTAVSRALRSLDTTSRFDPWVARPPASTQHRP